MAGRNRLHGVPIFIPIVDPSQVHTSVILEDRIAIQSREIQSLLIDNQRLAATHMALKQELVNATQELRHLSATSKKIKTEEEPQIREAYERSLKMDSEVRMINAMKLELAQVRADVDKLAKEREGFTAELQAMESDLEKAKSDSQRVPTIKAEIDTMRREIHRGRTAIEYENKNRASNLEHRQSMEKNMDSVAREIEKLRSELANAEKRARAAVAANPIPGYVASYGNPDIGYGRSPYAEPYGIHQHNVQAKGHVDPVLQYPAGAAEHPM